MSDEHDDPFAPTMPGPGYIGRLMSHGRLEAGWQCRWCSNLLGTLDNGNSYAARVIVCISCDLPL